MDRMPSIAQFRQLLAESPAGTLYKLMLEHAAQSPELECYREIWEDSAAPQEGPLAEIPIAIKDNIVSKRGFSCAGSKILEGFKSPFDATVLQRLREAGARPIGKTNMDEFGMGSSSLNTKFGQAKNPWDTSRICGGSSGGSAAAVASGLAVAALGSDTGGSVRQPAALCGLTGLKPSYGRVSRHGLIAYASSLEQVGCITRSAEDAAVLLEVIAGAELADAQTLDVPVPNYSKLLEQLDGPLRIGISQSLIDQCEQVDVADRLKACLKDFEALGFEIVPVELPFLKYALPAYYIIALAEAASNLSRYDGLRFGAAPENTSNWKELILQHRTTNLCFETKKRILLGNFVLSAGYFDDYYQRACAIRKQIQAEFLNCFESSDLLFFPVTSTTAQRSLSGQRSNRLDSLADWKGDLFTVSANLTGLPALSFCCGFDSAGMPVGAQLLAPMFEELKLLQTAHRYQQHSDHHQRLSPYAEGFLARLSKSIGVAPKGGEHDGV